MKMANRDTILKGSNSTINFIYDENIVRCYHLVSNVCSDCGCGSNG